MMKTEQTKLSVLNTAINQAENPSDIQIGGNHYQNMMIQPVEYIVCNKIPFLEGCAIKYISRHRSKGGEEDIDKAIHVLMMMKEFYYEKTEPPQTPKC